MSKKTLADHVIDVMQERGFNDISGADIEILGEAYSRFGGGISHPLDRNVAAMAAVRRSPKFEHDGLIRATNSIGSKAKLATFKIKLS